MIRPPPSPTSLPTPRRLALACVVALLAGCLWPLAARGKPRRPARPTPAQVAAANAALVAGITGTLREPDWRYIVLHHTAAETDSLKGISGWHAKRFGDPLGIQYHFLIGNGRSAPDGAIQIARWQHHVQSIHVAHPERAPTAITISLQGNLHLRAPSAAQMLAVETLVRHLMRLYRIPVDRISTNTRVDGTVTVCPGKHFPIDRLLHRLQHASQVTLADWREPLAPVPMDGPFADLAAIWAGLRWDRPCTEPIAVGPAVVLQTVADGKSGLQAHLVGIDGGRGCTPIQRRFVILRTAAGWHAREINGYRKARLKRGQVGGGVGVQVADERGPMQTCTAPPGQAPRCALVRPKQR